MKHIATTLDRLQDPISVVYDIGAYNGIWSKAFAIYTQGKVYSFEPNPEAQAELKQRIQHLDNIYLQPVACGAEEKEAIEYIDEHKGAASSLLGNTQILQKEFSFLGKSYEVPVDVVRLDDWVYKHNLPTPSLIKINVQGFENQVLAGGSSIVKSAKYIWIELNFKVLYEHGSTFSTVYKFLSDVGFELIDCFDLVRSKEDNSLIYMDGMFINSR